jgi:hypothetical protein
MNPETTIAELLRLWPRLPDLAGAHWPAMYWQLADLLRAFRHAATEQQRAGVAIRVQRLLASVPEVRAAWAAEDAVLVRGRDVLTRSGAFAGPATEDDVWVALDDLLQATAVTRWTDVLAPGRVQSGQRFAVIVGLTCQEGEGGQGKPMAVLPGQTVRVVLAATELEVIGPQAKELRVLADRDSDPVVFFVRAPQPGSFRAMLDFWVDQHVAASVSYSVLAVEAPAEPSGATTQPDVLVSVGPARVPHPDLILRVTTAGNRLRFDLDFADTRFVQIEGEWLRSDPETFRYDLLNEIEGLAAEKGKPQDFLARQLEKIGQRLYRDLFPAELRREYRRFYQHVHTLQIVSDEPWIPWELIKPYDDEAGQPPIDHDFLCLQFELARWVCPAPSSAAAEIPVDTLACIVPSDSGLAEAQGERDDLLALAAALGLTSHVPAPADLPAVETLLRGSAPIQLWHFACHGNVHPASPGKSPLYLENGTRLDPDDLVGPAQTHLKNDRPLVFLNACRVGSGGLSITGLGGWANVLVGSCGVGAVIAPLWSVNDELAREFASVFYDQLRSQPGCTIGRALRQARRRVRDAAPHDPTWLAYTLYAHPNTHVRLGSG